MDIAGGMMHNSIRRYNESVELVLVVTRPFHQVLGVIADARKMFGRK